METITDLQTLIDEKAIYKLKSEIKKISEVIRANRLFRNSQEFPQLGFKDKYNTPFWIFKHDSDFMDAIYDYWLPIYKEEAAKEFIQTVQELKENVDNLLDVGKINDFANRLKTCTSAPIAANPLLNAVPLCCVAFLN